MKKYGKKSVLAEPSLARIFIFTKNNVIIKLQIKTNKIKNNKNMFTKHYKIIITLAILFLTIVSVKLANDDSLTFDEVAHIPAGYSYVSEFDYRLNPEHPPLVKVLSGIPLLFLNLNFETSQNLWNETNQWGEYKQWQAGHHLLHEVGNNVDQITFFARLPIILISIGLALLLFQWGKKIGGTATGIFALLLCVFDPNILGHNHLVTTDIGIAAAMVFAFYFFLSFVRHPSWKNAFLTGLTLGIAQITKFSAILLVIFFVLLLITFIIFKLFEIENHKFRFILNYFKKSILIGFTIFFVIWLTYIPFTYNMPTEVLSTLTPAKINPDDGIIDQQAFNFIILTNKNSLTRSLGTYVYGVMYVKNRVAGGNGAYFMGQVANQSFPTYFPVAFITKQTLFHLFFYVFAISTFLILIYQDILKLFSQKITKSLSGGRKYILHNFTEISLILFIIFYLYISITGNLNIGFRHLFPIMPLIYLITARVCVNIYSKLINGKGIIAIRYVFIAMISLMITEVIWAYPYYISYFNQTVGGPKNGYKIMTDSNADWGQDLKRLEKYLNEHPEIDKIHVHYFGGDRPSNRLGEDRFIEWWDSKRPIEKGYYAISVNHLQGSIYNSELSDDNSYRWTLKYKPIAQVGTSFLIYKVE
ncbi:MAG: glycosyltransferase family 39 protein [Candidatus Moranbacteria bacterium]|nr:glycosyltransferase family 39 protein [Candidatus Moranbacteria bacterium]